MTRAARQLLILFVLFALPAIAAAQAFTVTLSNGTTFETRERPVAAEWDDSLVMLRTDQGNWIAIERDSIVDVVSFAENTGFGYQVDTKTVFVGWSPNDLVDDEEGDEDSMGGEGEDDGGEFTYEDTAIDDGYAAPAAEGGYSIQQFVDPIGGGSVGVGVPLDTAVVERNPG